MFGHKGYFPCKKKRHHKFHNHLIQNLFLSVLDRSKWNLRKEKNVFAGFDTKSNVDRKPFGKL